MAAMRDLFRDALDTTALVVEVGARFIADSITERRNAFSDDDAAAYLRCAGADALAEAFAARTTGVAQCLEHDLPATQCARMPHAEGDEWTPVATRLATEPSPIPPGDEGPVSVSPAAHGAPTCKHCAEPIELRTDDNKYYGRVGVWMHVDGSFRCKTSYASPQ